MNGGFCPTGSPVYHLSNIVKDYEGRRVLDIDELDIWPGEVLAVVGPSGSGKSTLLRLLAFLEQPSGGCLFFQGQDLSSGREIPLETRRRVTMVFQRPMLLNRPVMDNVRFGLTIRGNRDSHDQVESALEKMGLADLSHQVARKLSGGEAQRVALARAIVLEPDVLLLDEPTANLDPYNVGLIESIASQLNRERGTTLVLVTHNVFQARRLATRTAFLLNGKLVEIAKTEQFFASPTDPRTLAFVKGDMVY